MLNLLFLLPFAYTLILPYNFKQISLENSCLLGEGGYAKVCSVSIDTKQYALKRQKHFISFLGINHVYIENVIIEVSVILFAASKSSKHVIPPILISMNNEETDIGMLKMQSSLSSLIKPLDNEVPNKRALLALSEETLVDVVKGIAELHKIGISHNDSHTNNFLVNELGRAFLIDFGVSKLVPPVKTENATEYLISEGIARDHFYFNLYVIDLFKFLKRRRVNMQFDWRKIFRMLKKDGYDPKTFVWVASQLDKGMFKRDDWDK